MRFANFLFGGFITAIVVNPPEKKLAKRTSVDCRVFDYSGKNTVCFIYKTKTGGKIVLDFLFFFF